MLPLVDFRILLMEPELLGIAAEGEGGGPYSIDIILVIKYPLYYRCTVYSTVINLLYILYTGIIYYTGISYNLSSIL